MVLIYAGGMQRCKYSNAGWYVCAHMLSSKRAFFYGFLSVFTYSSTIIPPYFHRSVGNNFELCLQNGDHAFLDLHIGLSIGKAALGSSLNT